MKKILLLIIILSAISFAQQYSKKYLDSLYNQYISIREGFSVQNMAPGQITSGTQNEVVKCGFGPANILRLNIDKFSADQQNTLRKILLRPVTDTSIISPEGHFRIHFYKSGSEAPNYNVDSLAIAADSAWNFEINFLGFPPPPSDNGAGGDNRYDIYIDNLGNLYGQTTPEQEISPGSNKYTSYLEIDNDFPGFYTTGINAARVTVAHEFHHSIQIGDYIFRSSDLYFYELTSTSMEIFVYTSIPDYVNYLTSYFYNTGTSFGNHSGYDLAIWNLYLKDNFSYGIIKRQWELMPSMRALAAINTSLTERGSSFGKEFLKFGVWTYYTNYRAIPGQYFSLANKYPLVHPLSTVSLNVPSKSVTVNTTPATNNFVTFVASSLPDTLVALVSNIDYQSGIDSSRAVKSFQYTFYTDGTSGSIPVSKDYSAKLTVNTPANWLNADFLNNQLVNADTIPPPPVLTEIDYAYPSPYFYSKYNGIYIPAPINSDKNAIVDIYSLSMKLVYNNSETVNIDSKGHPVVFWPTREKSRGLSTGVYIYVVKSGGSIIKGKLVIFNQ